MAWQKFRVELADAEPVEVQTNARDWANVSADPGKPLDMTFRVVHAALLRTQTIDVPRSYEQFLDMLGDVPAVVGGDDVSLDPTQPTVSEGSQ